MAALSKKQRKLIGEAVRQTFANLFVVRPVEHVDDKAGVNPTGADDKPKQPPKPDSFDIICQILTSGFTGILFAAFSAAIINFFGQFPQSLNFGACGISIILIFGSYKMVRFHGRHWSVLLIAILSACIICIPTYLFVKQCIKANRDEAARKALMYTNSVETRNGMAVLLAAVTNQNWISIEPSESTDKKNPFKTRFIIQNTSPSETISNVGGIVMVTAPNDSHAYDNVLLFHGSTNINNWSTNQFSEWHFTAWSIPDRLGPNSKFTEDFRFNGHVRIGLILPKEIFFKASDGSPIATNAILMQIICSFISGNSQTNKEVFKFYTLPDSEGNFHWYPIGYGDLWDITNTLNVGD